MIGITGHRSLDSLPGYPPTLSLLRADTFGADYSAVVSSAGGIPVLLSREADPAAVVECVDGLILSGGPDVDPRRYGAVPGSRSTVLDPGRDAFEASLVHAAVRTGTPLLGICRGHQLLNVALGGSLIADLLEGHGESHSFLGYPPAFRSHQVRTEPDTVLAHLFGEQVAVNSFHHQAVDRLAPGARVTATAADGVIEGIELPGTDVIGVQWHPEMLDRPDPIFRWLIRRAAATQSERVRVSVCA